MGFTRFTLHFVQTRSIAENPSIDLGDFPAMSDCHVKGIKGRQRQRREISERDMQLEGINKYDLAKAKMSLSENTVIIPKSICQFETDAPS